jgi:hypothetical protein
MPLDYQGAGLRSGTTGGHLMTTLPIDGIVVGLAILVFSILLWGSARMIDQRLGHMETAMVNALHAIARFLDRQEERDRRDRPQPGPAE